MRRALELAREAFGTTSPNPSVGCVIVRDGVMLSAKAIRGHRAVRTQKS